MLAAYCPMFLRLTRSQYGPHGANTGDGHKMGLWAGGVMEDGPLPTVMHPQGYNRLSMFFLFVNIRGDRFMNEDNLVPGQERQCAQTAGKRRLRLQHL